MPADPKEYRQRALHCADLAHEAKTLELKQTLIELSRNWQKLAVDAEQSRAMLAEYWPEIGDLD